MQTSKRAACVCALHIHTGILNWACLHYIVICCVNIAEIQRRISKYHMRGITKLARCTGSRMAHAKHTLSPPFLPHIKSMCEYRQKGQSHAMTIEPYASVESRSVNLLFDEGIAIATAAQNKIARIILHTMRALRGLNGSNTISVNVFWVIYACLYILFRLLSVIDRE